MKIRVIDSECGSGKTIKAIQYMNKNYKHKNFIFITPFLSLIERVIDNTIFDIKQPSNGLKYKDFLTLIERGLSIVTTHSLFQLGDKELVDLLQEQRYELILDEVLEVVSIPKIFKGIKSLLDNSETYYVSKINNIVHLTLKGKLIWEDGLDKNTDLLFKLILTGRVILSNESFFLWLFPIELLQHFDKVTIMTYMFDNQTMCNYLKSNGAELEYYHTVRDWTVNPNDEPFTRYYTNVKYDLVLGRCSYKGSKYKDLINIYDGKLNDIGKKTNRFSSSWFNNKNNKKLFKILSNNSYNYLYNIIKTKSDDVIWTCLKSAYDNKDVNIHGYRNCFITTTQRATNLYKNKHTLVYLSNRYLNPIYVNYFKLKGLFTDNDIFALSEMIQWIFRSAIRLNQPINIYIPSKRMRLLLLMWLNDLIK